MWQKPAQPSASIYRAERVQQRPASARCSLSLSIRVPFVPASSLPRPPSCIFLPFRPVALRSSSSSFSSLITVGVARQQPVHTGARPTSFLRSSFSVLLSRSPSVLCAGLTRSLQGAQLPFSLSYPHAVIYHRAVGFFPFSSSPTPGATHPPVAHGCPSCSSTASHNVVLLLFPWLSFLNPFLPSCSQ